MPPRPDEIDTWVFDLDNTLYPSTSRVSEQTGERMGIYVAQLLEITPEAAQQVRKRLFREYGTTMRGLMTEYAIDPGHYMEFVHDVDISSLVPAPALVAALAALPGRKLIHTNASVRHAERILAHLGLTQAFTGVFDIEAADWEPKPGAAGYRTLIDRFGIEPGRAAMVEDIARNLRPAAEAGMLTLWVRSPNGWAIDGSTEPWVHHQTDDLAGWLGDLPLKAAAPRV